MEREIIFLVEEDPEGGYNAKALDHALLVIIAVMARDQINATPCIPHAPLFTHN